MTQRTVRITDVAREAGVSTATVSRALSNPELLTEATRETVFNAIHKTGYRVNQAARNLRMQRASAVLVLVPNLGNPFFSQILAGISAQLGQSDYSVLIADTYNGDVGDGLIDYFLDRRVDGMLSLDGSLSQAQMETFEANGVSNHIVFACEWVHDCALPSVRSDNPEGARMAIRHLYDLGHRKIAHVTGPKGNVLTRARREGMLEERDRLGLPARSEWIIRGDFSIESGAEAARQIIAMSDRPSAVFCASDMVAFGLISTLAEAGIHVPADISVVGFDDIEMSGYYVPAITTIRQDRRNMGLRAARLLLDRLGNSENAVGQGYVELINVELVERQSTGPVNDATWERPSLT